MIRVGQGDIISYHSGITCKWNLNSRLLPLTECQRSTQQNVFMNGKTNGVIFSLRLFSISFSQRDKIALNISKYFTPYGLNPKLKNIYQLPTGKVFKKKKKVSILLEKSPQKSFPRVEDGLPGLWWCCICSFESWTVVSHVTKVLHSVGSWTRETLGKVLRSL